MSIRIITDSASDVSPDMREDVTVLPLHLRFGDEEYLDGENITHEEFYKKLEESGIFPTTSQISPYEFERAIKTAKDKGEEVIIITLSSKLSGTYQSACIAAAEYEDMAYVVDSENVTIGEHTLIEYALRLKDSGMDVRKIVEELNHAKKNIRLVALLDTLEYLKKGGRVSGAVAAIGGVLAIKPVVGVVDGEVVMLGKASGTKKGNHYLDEQISLAGGVDFSKPYYLGYTGNDDSLLRQYIEAFAHIWKKEGVELDIQSVGSAIGSHLGPGAIGVAFFSNN